MNKIIKSNAELWMYKKIFLIDSELYTSGNGVITNRTYNVLKHLIFTFFHPKIEKKIFVFILLNLQVHTSKFAFYNEV